MLGLKNAFESAVKGIATDIRTSVEGKRQELAKKVLNSDVFANHIRYPGADTLPQLATPEPRPVQDPVAQCSITVHACAKLLTSNGSRVYKTMVQVAVEDSKGKTGEYKSKKAVMIIDETFEFLISDVGANVRVVVYQSSVLLPDALLGQVIVPLHRLLPEPSLSSFVEPTLQETGWYEILPLPADRAEFQPAVADVANTGMIRASKPLGYVWLSVKLERLALAEHPRDWPWLAYSMRPRFIPTRPTDPIHIAPDLPRTVRHLKRQGHRLKAAFKQLDSFAPTAVVKRALSWADPFFSSCFLSIASSIIIVAPLWIMPLCFFALLVWGAYICRRFVHPELVFVLYNDEIVDPDDLLNPVQLLSKVIDLLELLSRILARIADNIERALHVFSFRDTRVSATALALCFAAASSASFVLFFELERPLAVLALLFGCGPTFAFQAKPPTPSPSGLSKVPKAVQAVANVLSRSPTSETVAHRVITDLSRVKDEETLRTLMLAYEESKAARGGGVGVDKEERE